MAKIIRDFWVFDKRSVEYSLYMLRKKQKKELINSIKNIIFHRQAIGPDIYLNTPRNYISNHVIIESNSKQFQFMICSYCHNYIGHYIYGHNIILDERLRMICHCELTD